MIKPYKQQSPHEEGFVVCKESDDDLLSHGNPHYHRRRVVSLSCSGWEGVGPTRYGRQTNRSVICAVLQLTLFVVLRFSFCCRVERYSEEVK